MNTLRTLALAALIAAGAAIAWWYADSNREPADRIAAVDAGQAAVEHVLERTFRESRTGVEMPPFMAPPANGVAPQNVAAQPQTAADGPGTSAALAPEGYSLGTYHGVMQRAPSSGDAVPPPPQNPAWLDPAVAHEALLEQATQTGRDFTFAVLRLGPQTNVQDLDRALGAFGARIEGVSGEYARVRVPAERGRLESIAGLPGVLGLGALPPEQKAPEAFVQELRSRGAAEQVPVYITLMGADPAGQWRQALSSLGIVVGAWDSDLRTYTANMPAAALAPAMAADYVMAIEPVPVVRANHATSVPVMGVDGLRQYVPAEGRFTGLTGEGIAVGVLDTGLNTRHMDIAHGRQSVCGASFIADEHWDLWLDMHGHGTHVFGTIAGAGRADPLLAGVAPGLSHLRFGKVLSARGSGSGENIRRAMDHFSRSTDCASRGTISDAVKPLIVNMSLSATALHFSGRGVGERKLDAVVHAHSQLYVVAQANSGLHGFSNYGTAKNSLAVGAVEDSGLIARFSSHGPTADGRLAPNVVGTGVGLTSARGRGSVSGHDTLSGTSMAAPSVAGVAALLMEARPEFRNRPALARARLMASAIRPDAYFDSGGQLPADNSNGPGTFNNLYGLGLVSGRSAVFSNDSPGGWLNGSASAEPMDGAYEYIDIDVPEGASRLDIVLTWDEQPADTLTRSVLNNLDLWADRGADCGADACGEYASRSEVDNVEWLLIEDPAPGVYRIKAVPVEIYGGTVGAAVAWTIRRGEATPRLELQVQETSPPNAGTRHLVVDVTVDASGYVASGTTIHLGCRIAGEPECYDLLRAFLPNRSQVFRGDGQSRPLQYSFDAVSKPISVGEVAAGSPRRVQLWFLRDEVPPGATLHATASSWNALAGTRSIGLAADGAGTDEASADAPPNDSFSASERLLGGTGETRLDLALASREPGEPLVSAGSRTLWYEWEAPAKGLFRFRAREADSGRAATVDFALFTGDTLADLEPAAEKRGSEISFDAKAGARMRLRIASGGRDALDDWDLPLLALEWEPADIRPGNDDFDFANAIEGESGTVSSTNEGATLEHSEFWGGLAATVWYEWTATADGFAEFTLEAGELKILAFRGTDIGALRLGAEPASSWRTGTGGRTVFAVRSGETWRIALASEDADSSGQPFTLSWEIRDSDPLAGSRNSDFFADAIPISGPEGRVGNLLWDGISLNYTVEASEPPETGIATGWWHWTAPRDGRFTWQMDGSTAYRLAIFTGDALETLQRIGTLVGGSALVLDATADTRYWISIGRAPEEVGTNPSRPTEFRWGLSPANDDRASAAPITGGAGSVGASLVYATAEADEPRSAVGLDSVWWNWRAPATGWYRFSVEGNPLHAIVQIFPGGDSEAASSHVIGNSERSFLANGRVDVHVLVREGQRFDIRLSRRPGVGLSGSDRLVWAPSEAPAYLSYKGAVTEESLISNPVFDGSWSPRHLAMTDNGMFLFSTVEGQLLGFVRDGESGELALAYRASTEENRETLDPDSLRPDSHVLWWNPSNETLFAVAWCDTSYSFALPDDGTTLNVRRIDRIDLPGARQCVHFAAQGDRGGTHLYAIDEGGSRLLVLRADSPTSVTHVQTVSGAASDDDSTMVPNIVRPADLALAPDGRHLYLADEFGLFVFFRDMSSGRLALAGEVPLSNDPEGPFYQMGALRHATIDASGAVLFVAGSHRENSVTDTAVAAFDISADPSNPAHLDTLTDFHFREADQGMLNAWNHLQPRRNAFSRCDKPVAHGELPAMDVFCRNGYFVVQWNPETSTLEVTDFAVSGDRDRFGNPVPVLGYRDRQMAQSPDGAHVYRTTHWQDQGQSSAIHIFERAGAMVAKDETVPPTDGVTDASPSFAAGGGPGDLSYAVDTAIAALALPEATGGNGPLAYSLSPTVPGLTFDATARRLSDTPTAAGAYEMTYTHGMWTATPIP